MLRGENMQFRPAIFIWFVLAQSFFKFRKHSDIQKLKAWSFRLWNNDFCRLYNELARALQSAITFFYTPCTNVFSKEQIINTDHYCLGKPITKRVHIR